VLSGTSYHNMIGILAGHETVAVRPGRITSSNIGRDKSFVDDLNREQGIVRMRVAFVPRSTEIKPESMLKSGDLELSQCYHAYA
jgi:hypothetical protein